jgi:hypothetical protein
MLSFVSIDSNDEMNACWWKHKKKIAILWLEPITMESIKRGPNFPSKFG